MKDRIVEYPHRYQLIQVSGQPDTFDIIPAPGTVTEEGTPLNKGNLLSDEVAGYTGVETVSQALLNTPNFLHRDVITASGTWIAPRDGLINVILVGGGGGGGASIQSNYADVNSVCAGGGGGGGGEIKSVLLRVNQGDDISIITGAGGNGGSGVGVGAVRSGPGGLTLLEPFGLYAKGGAGGGTARGYTGGGGGLGGKNEAGGAGGQGGTSGGSGEAGTKTYADMLVMDTMYASKGGSASGAFCGGGGGGGYNGAGGVGTLGNGADSLSYGGGGGGGGVKFPYNVGYPGGKGGDGIVIIRY